MSTRLFPAAVLAAAILTAPAAQARPWEVGALVGIQLPDPDLSGSGEGSSEFPATVGLRGDVWVSDQWGLFADGLFSSIGSSKPFGDATMLHGRFGAELLFPGYRESQQFYAAGGIGVMNVDLDAADSFTRPYWSFGIGSRWTVSERTRMRFEVRGDRTMGDGDDAVGRAMHQFEALVGLAWAFGGEQPDTDGDGVTDDKDRCPDTPHGARVDERGCPKDTDGDGVWDGLDRCPGTLAGTAVDEHGCPRDSDGDGVTDEKDQCPNTPQGVEVDVVGCPKIKRLFEAERTALVLEGVNFEFDSARLTEASSETLDEVAASLLAWPDVAIEIGGHTDSAGPHAYNVELSRRRAEAVQDYLAAKGVAAERMTTKGYGPDEPAASNDTHEGRARNRRVELKRR